MDIDQQKVVYLLKWSILDIHVGSQVKLITNFIVIHLI